MKNVLPKAMGPKKTPPVLPLEEDDETYHLDKTNSVTWELSTQPGTAGAATYKYQVRILTGSESPRQLIRWRTDLAQVVRGLNLTTVATIMPIHLACMRAGPKSIYEAACNQAKQSTYEAAMEVALATDHAAGNNAASTAVRGHGVDHYARVADLTLGIDLVVADQLPRQVLAKAKRSLRRDTRKPYDMKIRKYYQALLRINNEELPNLPPFAAGQSLNQDEMIDILLHGTPRSWQNEMERQGFDPMDQTPNAVVDFMENIEGVEDATFEKVKDNKNGKDKKKSSSSSSAKKQKFHCTHHGPNNSHDTKDCKVLKGKSDDKSSSSKKPYGNKTWVRKAAESNSASKKELAAFVQKEVKKGVKKQLASVSKKRKNDSDDESDAKDCFLLEELSKGIDGFNYNDMEKLSINDDEVSV